LEIDKYFNCTKTTRCESEGKKLFILVILITRDHLLVIPDHHGGIIIEKQKESKKNLHSF